MIFKNNETLKAIAKLLTQNHETVKEALNATQKSIIEDKLNFVFDAISELKPMDAITALEATLGKCVSQQSKQFFKEQDVWRSIKEIRQILSHPCPQNRCENYPYFGQPSDPNIVIYKNFYGKPDFEEKGLLGLTGYNNSSALSVTKEAVVNYIHQLVNNALDIQRKKITEEENNLAISQQNTQKDYVASFSDHIDYQLFSLWNARKEIHKSKSDITHQMDINNYMGVIYRF